MFLQPGEPFIQVGMHMICFIDTVQRSPVNPHSRPTRQTSSLRSTLLRYSRLLQTTDIDCPFARSPFFPSCSRKRGVVARCRCKCARGVSRRVHHFAFHQARDRFPRIFAAGGHHTFTTKLTRSLGCPTLHCSADPRMPAAQQINSLPVPSGLILATCPKVASIDLSPTGF